MLKFLNGHKKMIELDVNYTRENLSMTSFSSYEDKVLLIFCIIIVKNINNLLLELGPLAVKAFFMDVKKDFLVNWSSHGKRGRGGVKRDKAIEIIDSFCDPNNTQSPLSSSFFDDAMSQSSLSGASSSRSSLRD